MRKIIYTFLSLLALAATDFAQARPCINHADNNAYFLRGVDEPVLNSKFWLSDLDFYIDVDQNELPRFRRKFEPFGKPRITKADDDVCKAFIQTAFITAKLEMVRRHPSFEEAIKRMEAPSVGFTRGLMFFPGSPPTPFRAFLGQYCPDCSPEIRVSILESSILTVQALIHEHLHYIVNFLPLGESKSQKEHDWIEKTWRLESVK